MDLSQEDAELKLTFAADAKTVSLESNVGASATNGGMISRSRRQ